MDFRQLKSFVTVVEYKSFSKAAEKLHSAQPTISTHVRMLEEELKTRLILRTTKTIEITPQGMEAYKYASKILALRDCIQERCSANSRCIIRVGASTIPATYVLPEVLPQYTQNAPETYFAIHQSNSREIADGVMDGQFDLGLTGMPIEREGMVCVPFCRNRIVLITPVTEHFLNLQRKINVPQEDFFKVPIVLREQGSKKSANRFLEAMGINEDELDVVARVNDQEAVKNMVAQGMGVSLISEIAARSFIRERRLLKFDLPEIKEPQYLYLIYRNRFGANSSAKDFIDFLTNYEVI